MPVENVLLLMTSAATTPAHRLADCELRLQARGCQRRRPQRLGLRDAEVLDLRIDALDADAQVLLERELHCIVHRQAPGRARLVEL